MSRKTSITLDEWLNAMNVNATPPPDGAITITEVMKKTGMKRSAATNLMSRAVESNHARVHKCLANGRWVKFYELMDPKMIKSLKK